MLLGKKLKNDSSYEPVAEKVISNYTRVALWSISIEIKWFYYKQMIYNGEHIWKCHEVFKALVM